MLTLCTLICIFYSVMQKNHSCITRSPGVPVSRFQPKISFQTRPNPPGDAQTKNVDSTIGARLSKGARVHPFARVRAALRPRPAHPSPVPPPVGDDVRRLTSTNRPATTSHPFGAACPVSATGTFCNLNSAFCIQKPRIPELSTLFPLSFSGSTRAWRVQAGASSASSLGPATRPVLRRRITYRPAQPIRPILPLRRARPCPPRGVLFPRDNHHETPVFLRSPAISCDLLRSPGFSRRLFPGSASHFLSPRPPLPPPYFSILYFLSPEGASRIPFRKIPRNTLTEPAQSRQIPLNHALKMNP